VRHEVEAGNVADEIEEEEGNAESEWVVEFELLITYLSYLFILWKQLLVLV